jgi:elongation factor Ts
VVLQTLKKDKDMTIINANTVKELREKTGAGMMDCKKALTESNGDFESAVDWLRKKGLSAAAKKSGRITAEGLVAVAVKNNSGAILELNSETDFVAKNDKFQILATTLINDYLSFNGNEVEQFSESICSSTGKKVSETISENIAIIGENIALRRASKLFVKEGAVCSYIHNQIAPGLGKIGVIVGLESKAPVDKLMNLGRQIAMHIAASKPESLSITDLDPTLIQKERDILREQARLSGKPEAVIEKMVEGRISKFYEQVVLLEQPFVMDGKTKVSEIINTAAKEAGTEIKVTGYTRFTLGEGVNK